MSVHGCIGRPCVICYPPKDVGIVVAIPKIKSRSKYVWVQTKGLNQSGKVVK